MDRVLNVCASWTTQLVDQTHTGDHVCGLNRAPDHAENQVVPVLVDLSTSDLRLELELQSKQVVSPNYNLFVAHLEILFSLLFCQQNK